MVNFISYIRVSTERQGRSGLGLEAQRDTVAHHIKITGGTLLEEFLEVETGKGSNALARRPQLRAALDAAKRAKAVLIIAKLDRLARNVAFIATLMDSKVEFIAADNPHATRLTLHILAAVAEHEREMISQRTKAALQAAKARGTRLGVYSDVLSVQNKADAVLRLTEIGPVLLTLRKGGLSTRKIAAQLNLDGVASPGGGLWHRTSVQRALGRLQETADAEQLATMGR
jgi:DNA invertase Pin-like site-specific DNA recombinase